MDINTVVKQFFRENLNITLREEWLTEVVTYLRSLNVDGNSLLTAVYEEWLYSDLRMTSLPVVSLPSDKHLKKATLQGRTVVQVVAITDIGTSQYSQLKKLTYKFQDNSDFQLKPEEEEASSAPFEQKSKRMLSLEVTDGQSSMKAVEYNSLNALSLFTFPGCKILLTSRVRCRRCILLLTELNCVVLGGDDEVLMKTGRPVEVMMKRLSISTSSKKQNSIGSTTNANAEGNRSIPTTCTVNETASSQLSISKPVMQVKPLSEEELLFKTPKRKALTADRIKQSVKRVKREVKTLKDEENPCCSGTRSPNVTVTPKRTRNQPTQDAVHTKRIKMETFDNDVIVIETPKPVKKETKRDVSPAKTVSPAIPSLSPDDHPVLAEYKRQRIEPIAEALQSMRFAVGPRRKKLAAIMETKPVDPLHVNDDGMWTLTVALSDESYECLTCIVSHTFLVELIGWTPQEALAARASKDPTRRKEGTLRTRSAGQSMRRLDLIWEVEFFPPGGSTPIIHKIDTYAQKFGLI